jgi:hypothetical protein
VGWGLEAWGPRWAAKRAQLAHTSIWAALYVVIVPFLRLQRFTGPTPFNGGGSAIHMHVASALQSCVPHLQVRLHMRNRAWGRMLVAAEASTTLSPKRCSIIMCRARLHYHHGG